MRQSRAEAIQDYITPEEMMRQALQSSTKIALDQKMLGYCLERSSTLTDQDISRIRIKKRKATLTCVL